MNSGDYVGTDRGERLVDTGRCPSDTVCDHHVYVPESTNRWLQESHATFSCPAGHRQSFAGPSPSERAKREALARAATEERLRKQYEAEADRAKRRCPWPTCDGRLLASERGLRQHMVRAHGAPWALVELSGEEVAQVLNGRDPADVVR